MSAAQTALHHLARFCQEQNHRLTPPREYVLSIIAASKKPLTAYEILERLAKKLDKPQPPTAYRALEFLQMHGFVHRIESLNAYIACRENHHHRGSQFLVCDTCGNVDEIHLCSLPQELKNQIDNKKFVLSHWNVELHGKCKSCP